MDYLQQLLKDQTVEWKKLGEVAELVRGNGLAKKDFAPEGVPAIHYGQIYTYYGNETQNTISFVTAETASRLRKVYSGNVVITNTSENLEDVCKALLYSGKAEAVTGGHATIVRCSDKLLPKFFVYYTNTRFFFDKKRKLAKGTKVIDVSANDLARIEIPLPPLSVQSRIVEILDKFTALEAELEAELELRKKQYQHYREQLLNFSSPPPHEFNVIWRKLGEVFHTRNGYTPSKNNPEYWEGGTIPWYRMEDIRVSGRILNDALQHITPKGVKRNGLFKTNSIILATTATIGEHAMLTTDALCNQQFTNFTINENFKELLLPKFAFYYFYVIDDWCKKNVNVGNFPSVDVDKLKKVDFPLPPLSVQSRIVEILDKFDALTNSITEGLPLEIKLRKQQYEYYREQLLDFRN